MLVAGTQAAPHKQPAIAGTKSLPVLARENGTTVHSSHKPRCSIQCHPLDR